jgi:hypothetical protein
VNFAENRVQAADSSRALVLTTRAKADRVRRSLLRHLLGLPFVGIALSTWSTGVVVRRGWVLSKDD